MSMESLMKSAVHAAVRLIAAACLLGGLAIPASALVEIDITRGNVEPLPIAIPNFTGGGQDGQLGVDVAGVISADLKRSGRCSSA